MNPVFRTVTAAADIVFDTPLDLLDDIAGGSARISIRAEDAESLASALLDDPTPVWPGTVRRASVERITKDTPEGTAVVRVTWRRLSHGSPSWKNYAAQVPRLITEQFPDCSVEVEKIRRPRIIGVERDRPL
ncbi:MAG: hypothetical protein ACTIL2_09725 [Corynebacterium sp.]|uniref:hypothetical protein n=1 Tax=Corynebacterium sp. TaxID=1720 RepID=UPI003F9D172D